MSVVTMIPEDQAVGKVKDIYAEIMEALGIYPIGSNVMSKAVRLILACLVFLGVVIGAVLLFQQIV